ncbi:TPA: divergent PAP2 family protein [Candidatus Saccharibacteria bacterium]|nr:divergent PAP2 family protein [Candidatus Saccharibacteria bacterium]HIO87674.1 divergent PAP2 family protein [Candidatus Saccharibacteria bacterium]
MYQFLAAPITGWFLAQLIKFAAAALRGDVDFAWFWRSGGMPSAHSTTVVALVSTVGFLSGFSSAVFAVTATFAAIVIYDSVGVRQAVGNHSKLLEKLRIKSQIDHRIKQTLGHTLPEVLGGIVLGAVIGIAYAATANKVGGLTDFISTPLSGAEFRIAWVLVLLLLVGAASYNAFALRNRKTPTFKRLRKTVFYSVILPTMFAGLFIVLAQQQVSAFEWRMWVWSTLVLVIVLQISYSIRFYSKIPLLVKEENARLINKVKPKRNSKKRKRK